MSLETIEIETGAKPDAAVIWLHGLGADGHDFEPIVPDLIRRGERSWRFVFPHAPVRPVTFNGGMPMRAWYDIVAIDRRAKEDEAGLRQTDGYIKELIAQEVSRGIVASRIVLAGFSQGGAASLYTAPRYPERLAGVMALSTYLPLAARLGARAVRQRVAHFDGFRIARRSAHRGLLGRVASISDGACGVRRGNRGHPALSFACAALNASCVTSA
jgi:phospholipase/carboxylesterase